MRTIKGIEVPDWFIINRAPYTLPEPEKKVQVVLGEHEFAENYNPSLKEINEILPSDITSDCVEISSNTTTYDGDTQITVSWFEIVDNPEYESLLQKYNEFNQRFDLWNKLKQQIESVNETILS